MCYFLFHKDISNFVGCKSFVKTCIPVNFFIFIAPPLVIFFKNNFLIDQSIGVAYHGFHTLLHFEHHVFLALDNLFYNMLDNVSPVQVYYKEAI